MAEDLLFCSMNLHEFLEGHKQTVRDLIGGFAQEAMLQASEEELNRHFLAEYDLDPPRLLEDSIYVDEPSETEIDVTGDPRYDWNSPFNRRPTVRGTRIVVHVPFDGESIYFKCQPNRFGFNPPRARVEEGELLLVYEVARPDADALTRLWQRDVAQINDYLESIRLQVEECRGQLQTIIAGAVASRKERLAGDRGVVAKLGLPVRRSGDETSRVSLPRKQRPRPASQPPLRGNNADPTIDDEEYDHILDVISSVTVAIERSPTTFRDMGEEQLRDQILIQLNGHYEGGATGETFNRGGKTDILVRVDDKNVFIGECKFWKGKEAFLPALDQLFGYTCWSDTKTALIIFNRNRDHTRVLETIKDQVPQHPKHIRTLAEKAENHFRYLFEHPEDSRRGVYVAVLAINMPRE